MYLLSLFLLKWCHWFFYIPKQIILPSVDASSAGSGMLTAEVKGHTTAPPCEIVPHANGHYVVSFEPREVVPHYVNLMFNGDKVPGVCSEM